MQATAAKVNTSPACAGFEKRPITAALEALAQAKVEWAARRADKETANAGWTQGKQEKLRQLQRVASYDDVDQCVSEASAENISSGGTTPIPAKVEQRYKERGAERERLDRIDAGLGLLARKYAASEQAEKEAELRVTSLAADVMIDVDGAAILEETAALDRRRAELEELAEGLNLAVSAISMPLPADAKAKLAARLRKLREAFIGPKRNPVPWGLQAEHSQRVMQPWMERFNELAK